MGNFDEMKLLATKAETRDCVTGPGTWEVCRKSEEGVGWHAGPGAVEMRSS